jgi:hypothetical protein
MKITSRVEDQEILQILSDSPANDTRGASELLANSEALKYIKWILYIYIQ